MKLDVLACLAKMTTTWSSTTSYTVRRAIVLSCGKLLCKRMVYTRQRIPKRVGLIGQQIGAKAGRRLKRLPPRGYLRTVIALHCQPQQGRLTAECVGHRHVGEPHAHTYVQRAAVIQPVWQIWAGPTDFV